VWSTCAQARQMQLQLLKYAGAVPVVVNHKRASFCGRLKVAEQRGCAIRPNTLTPVSKTPEDEFLGSVYPDKFCLGQLLPKEVTVTLFVGPLSDNQWQPGLLVVPDKRMQARKVLIPHCIGERSFFCQSQLHCIRQVDIGMVNRPACPASQQIAHVVFTGP